MIKLQEMIPPSMLFRFEMDLFYDRRAGTTEWCPGFDESHKYRLPVIEAITRGEIFAEWCGAWSESGLSFSCAVRKRRSSLWCRPTRMDSSDRVELYLNMRPWASIRRPAEYCMRVCALPEGSGTRGEQPFVVAGAYRSSKYEQYHDRAYVRVERQGHDYRLFVSLNHKSLGYFEPDYSPNVGFSYCVHDHTLGIQTWGGVPAEVVGICPDLWAVLHLVR